MSLKAKVLLLAFALAFILQQIQGYDVLMVVGGMYVNQSVAYTVKAVEVIGLTSVCQIDHLPEQRHSLFGGRLSDRAIVCGGNDGTWERAECFVLLNNANGRWQRMTPDLGQPLIFAAAAGDGRSNFYVVGGRKYNFDSHFWDYQTEARVYNKRDNLWRTLQPLANPIANGCLLTLGSTLILSGGAKQRYVYANDPSKVYTLNVSDSRSGWRDDKIPEMLGNRMWHGCTLANVDNEISLLVAGGYYNGRATMSIPLTSLLQPDQANDRTVTNHHACHDNRLIDRESPFTNTANGWTIDCDMGVWDTADQIENLDVPRMCSNWYGFMNNDPIGSISTTFHGRGRARLDFGNCWTSGTVYAYLNGNAIAAASANTPRKTVEFDFNIGSILKITEENVGIIQFNSLDIIQCNEENNHADQQATKPRWNYLGYLEQERQWGPALGLVGGKPTIATGKNYGDVTIDTLENEYHWTIDRKRELRYKREFVVALTVPHTWFPSHCGF